MRTLRLLPALAGAAVLAACQAATDARPALPEDAFATVTLEFES